MKDNDAVGLGNEVEPIQTMYCIVKVNMGM